MLILCSPGGTGKSCLANEYGHQIKTKENGCIVRWINADTADKFETSFRQLARLFDIPYVEILDSNDLIDHLISKIISLENKFIFILDNVEEYELIEYLSVRLSDLSENLIKVLITSRNKNIPNYFNKEHIIEIEAFNLEETNLYLEKHLTVFNDLNITQKERLIELVKVKDKILPTKLELTVLHINENLLGYEVNDLLNEMKVNSNTLEYVFIRLPIKARQILAYCAFLDPSFISLNIINKIFGETEVTTESLKQLAKNGLIELNERKKCVKLQRLVHEEIKECVKNNSQDIDELQVIVNKIIEALTEYASVEEASSKDKNAKAVLIEQKYAQVKWIIQIVDEICPKENKILIEKLNYCKLKEKLAKYYIVFEIKYFKSVELSEANLKEYASINEISDNEE